MSVDGLGKFGLPEVLVLDKEIERKRERERSEHGAE